MALGKPIVTSLFLLRTQATCIGGPLQLVLTDTYTRTHTPGADMPAAVSDMGGASRLRDGMAEPRALVHRHFFNRMYHATEQGGSASPICVCVCVCAPPRPNQALKMTLMMST